jgi:hypothetical protein
LLIRERRSRIQIQLPIRSPIRILVLIRSVL